MYYSYLETPGNVLHLLCVTTNTDLPSLRLVPVDDAVPKACVQLLRESAGGIVVTTSACHAGDTGSITGTGSCDIQIWLSTLGTVYPS